MSDPISDAFRTMAGRSRIQPRAGEGMDTAIRRTARGHTGPSLTDQQLAVAEELGIPEARLQDLNAGSPTDFIESAKAVLADEQQRATEAQQQHTAAFDGGARQTPPDTPPTGDALVRAALYAARTNDREQTLGTPENVDLARNLNQ